MASTLMIGLLKRQLRAGLHMLVSHFGLDKPTLYIDARSFDDHKQYMRHHNGRHPEIISRTVTHRRCYCWLAEVRHLFLEVLSEWGSYLAYEPTMTVIIYCRSGRHRAVATSEILTSVVANMRLLKCLPIVHCSLDEDKCQC